jgi:hypothetical protein
MSSSGLRCLKMDKIVTRTAENRRGLKGSDVRMHAWRGWSFEMGIGHQ